MTRLNCLQLYLLALLPLCAVAVFQHSPGYMDADYYLITGQQLAQGHGFNEPVLWNYLDDPQGLPHPSHAYWMPLPSLVAAIGLSLFRGAASFQAGRVFFVLVAALVPPLTARLTFDLTQRRELAFFAAGIAIFSGFYLSYLPTTDTFSLSIVLGALFFILLIRKIDFSARSALALGAIAGLLHLTRAEGLLWLALALMAVWIRRVGWRTVLATLSGYLLVMMPWMLRNLSAFGTLLPAGAGRTLWLTNYNDLFAYPASLLNPQYLLSSGWPMILSARFSALGQNLLSAFVVQGLIFLVPLAVWGAWRLRDVSGVRSAFAAWLTLLFAMSLLFPFSGSRGGFFHAAAVLQPMVWALAAVGFQAFLDWGAARRGWQQEKARRVFMAGALLLALALSLYTVNVRVVGSDLSNPGWNESDESYSELGNYMDELGIPANTIVMVNNPPGFNLATGYSTIVVPDGDIETSLAAAERYGAVVLLIEANHPVGLDILYQQPMDLPGLSYIATIDGSHIFFIEK